MKPRPWTYSHLDQFETCPRRFHEVKIAKKFTEPPSEHIKWGNEVHAAFEKRVLDGYPLPDGMKQWEAIATKLASLPGEKYVEKKMAIDKAFKPSDYWQSWSRGQPDLLVVSKQKAAVLDYKTGKRKPTEQLDLYALYVFAHFPEVDSVDTAFVWLKDKKIDRKTITRAEVPMTWQAFLPRVAKLESAYERESWPARPSGLCKGWCPVASCEHHRTKG
jgi:CRISPR/Cas system-associated exonuclease Cas4 (RecB family)